MSSFTQRPFSSPPRYKEGLLLPDPSAVTDVFAGPAWALGHGSVIYAWGDGTQQRSGGRLGWAGPGPSLALW